MAVVLRMTVAPATREQCQEPAEAVGEAMGRRGGPLPGLMAHVAHPEADGFTLLDVWRSEPEAREFVVEVLQPLLDELGLETRASSVDPAWSFARP